MYYVTAVIALTVATAFIQAASLPVTPPTYFYDYYDNNITYHYNHYGPRLERPFIHPGEIYDGITVAEVVKTLGEGWNADNWLQSINIACQRHGSDVSNILNQLGQEGIVEEVCEAFETGQIEEVCGKFWDLATRDSESSISLISSLRCRDNSYNYHYNYNYNYYGPDDGNSTNYFYSAVAEAEKEALSMVSGFNPYDPCSETGIEKVNNIIFALMDWLGPSIYASMYYGEIEPHSACGILRYVLSLDITEYVNEVIGIERYLAADILESLQAVSICKLSEVIIEETLAIRIAKDLLVEYSGLSESDFCDFIETAQSREAYLEQGETILRNLIYTLADEETCNNVVEILIPLDKQGIHFKITGFNLTIATERVEFCDKASQAFSLNSDYVPTPYKPPPGFELQYVQPFETPGELLPDLTFIDLLNIEGASWRAEKLIDGFAVYCIVFEDFLSEAIDENTFDVKRLCDSLKSRDTASIENLCLTLLPALNFYSDDRPIELRPFHPFPIALYTARQLTGIGDISKDEVCQAADDAVNELSVRDVVETTIDNMLAEAILSLNSVCENFEAAVCKWKRYCPVPERSDYSSNDEVTRFPYYIYRPYIPSPEEVAEAHADFDEKFSIVLSILLTLTGFDSQDDLCGAVAEFIDPFSGRADITFVESLRSQIIGILTDVVRCSSVVDTALSLISERDAEGILTDGNTNVVYQLTGYESSVAFCRAVADSIEAETAVSVSTQANVQLAGTYNIFAKIAVYVQRVARSI